LIAERSVSINQEAAVQDYDPPMLELQDDVSVLRFPRIPLFAAALINHKKSLLRCLERGASDPAIRALVPRGSPHKTGRDEYSAFVHRAVETDDHFLSKMLNAFNQIILQFAKNPKPMISADSGVVLSQFLHMTLWQRKVSLPLCNSPWLCRYEALPTTSTKRTRNRENCFFFRLIRSWEAMS
jgi:hypothetical protein